MKLGNGHFINDDCWEVMSKLPDQSVDMVLCDLPYGVVNWTNPYSWDEMFDIPKLFSEYLRVLKPNGAIVLFGSEPYSTIQRSARLDLFKYDIVWVKNKVTSPFLAKVKPLRSHELISVFSQGTTSPGRKNNMPYFPQGLVKKERTVKNSKKDRMVAQVRPSTKDEYVQEYTNYPKDVVHFDCENGFHPTQKPVALFEYLIKTYTEEGALVLDNCAGSGSTAIAAQNTNRRWICIEKDEEYAKKAIERIEKNLEEIKTT